jgi:hypothetical protein
MQGGRGHSRASREVLGGTPWEIQITIPPDPAAVNSAADRLRRASRIPCASGKPCAQWSIKENSHKAERQTATYRLSRASRHALRGIKPGVAGAGVAAKVAAATRATCAAFTTRHETKILRTCRKRPRRKRRQCKRRNRRNRQRQQKQN